MARYRRYRRTIVRAPKKKWGSNFVDVSLTANNPSANPANIHDVNVLAENKAEPSAPTPVIIKTGNFKFQGDCSYRHSGENIDTTTVAGACLYIIFIPEGFNPVLNTEVVNLIKNHPEWILAWRYLESGVVNPQSYTNTNRFTFSSRLKRNLNSGDQIRAYLLIDQLPAGATITLKGQCQFWTCAN